MIASKQVLSANLTQLFSCIAMQAHTAGESDATGCIARKNCPRILRSWLRRNNFLLENLAQLTTASEHLLSENPTQLQYDSCIARNFCTIILRS